MLKLKGIVLINLKWTCFYLPLAKSATTIKAFFLEKYLNHLKDVTDFYFYFFFKVFAEC